MTRGLLLSVLCLLIAVSAPAQQKGLMEDVVRREMQSEQRVALVVGNAAYRSAPLRNPVNDAKAMGRTLRACGFEVIERIDCDRPAIRDAILTFGDRIKAGGVGLFYFSGHGVQVGGANYLVPIGANPRREHEVDDVCVRASAVLQAMEKAGNRVNIVILDACRDNPFSRFKSPGRGLLQMNAATGSILAYATAPGKVADDGAGENGLYTSVLLKHLMEPGLKIEDVFKQVRVDVAAQTRGAQVPWESTSLIGDFFFVLPAPGPSSGSIRVAVNVSARLFVDGHERGRVSPGQPVSLDMAQGTHTVRAEAPGRVPREQTVTVLQGRTTEVSLLLPKTGPGATDPVVPPPEGGKGDLFIKSEPEGATVRIDGEVVGETPVTVRGLSPGPHRLHVEKALYHPLVENVQVVPGVKWKDDIVLRPNFGSMSLRSEPSDALVYLDGQQVGRTPYERERLQSRAYSARLVKEWYHDWKGTVAVRDGEAYAEEVVLKPAFGSLTVCIFK